MECGDNPYDAPRMSATPSTAEKEGDERTAEGIRRAASLWAAMAPLAFVTLVMMLISSLENSQYPYGGTLLGTEIQEVRAFIRFLFIAWFGVAAFTIFGVARILKPSTRDSDL